MMMTHSSTHFDALAHSWYDDLLYNGFHHETTVTSRGAQRCSIQNLVSGVVSRGILARLRTAHGRPPSSRKGPVHPRGRGRGAAGANRGASRVQRQRPAPPTPTDCSP